MSENNDNSSDSNSRPDSILQASRLNNPIRAGVLRPSVLGSSLNSSNAVNSDGKSKNADNDVATLNPFLREQKDDDGDTEEDGGAAAPSERKREEHDDDDERDDRPDPLNLLAKNGFERSSMFAAAKNSIPRVEKSGFVFGQNVHERVTGENVHVESSSKSENSTASADSPLLFSSVIQAAAKPDNEAIPKESTDAKSLTEVAREYEESRAQKRKFEEVETFTGEEDEVNIVDVSCKLFAFVNSNWEERGRGSLRLNDSKTQRECSRVVFRTSGNLRLLVNTKVWAGMVAERPSQKSMRLTAMDNTGQIKVFLVMSRPVDISNLHKALVDRIEKVKLLHPLATVDCDDSNDGKNGSAEKCEVAASASVPAPPEHAHVDGDGESEPSPKKSLVATAAAAAESD